MSKFKKISLLVIAAAIIGSAGFFWQRSHLVRSPYSSDGNETKTLAIGNTKFQAEVVSSKDKLELGLGGRDNLCSTCAMLFVFPKSGIYSFWMKGMQFPLDILWISDSKIVQIEKNVQSDFAGILTPQENAENVLEINAGVVDILGLKMGDTIGL